MDIQFTLESTDPVELDQAISLLTDLREMARRPIIAVTHEPALTIAGSQIAAAELSTKTLAPFGAPVVGGPEFMAAIAESSKEKTEKVDIAALATQLIGKKGIPFVADLVKQVNDGVKARVTELQGKARDNFIIAAQDALEESK